VNYAELLDYSDSQFCHIAELNKTNKKLEKRIAELEKALSHAETASTKERDIRDLEQQAKGRLDGVAYALNMYCTTMSPKEFPPIGEYYAGQLQTKALKEQVK